MNIDTNTIRRLRDGLVMRGTDLDDPGPGSEFPASYQRAVLERFAPFAETMFLMMQVDGHSADAELDAIRGAMLLLTDGALSHESLEDIFEQAARDVEKQGVERRLQSVGTQLSADRADRETAFSLAAAIAIADDKVESVEIILMESIAEWYGISSKRCKEILNEL